MALTSVEIERYAKMALNVDDFKLKRDLYVSYDAQADVAYINFYNPPKPASDSELTDSDIIIRYDDEGEVVGLTILHASSRRVHGSRGRQAIVRMWGSRNGAGRKWVRHHRYIRLKGRSHDR